MTDDIPAETLRRRKLFDKMREEVRRLKPDTTGLSEDLSEAEIIESLINLERLERAEVMRLSAEYCAQLEREAAAGLPVEGDELKR